MTRERALSLVPYPQSGAGDDMSPAPNRFPAFGRSQSSIVRNPAMGRLHPIVASGWVIPSGYGEFAWPRRRHDGLSDRGREVLDLAYRHGLGATELAEVLGVTLATATAMVYRFQHCVVPAALPSGPTVFLAAPGWLRTRTLNRVRLPG